MNVSIVALDETPPDELRSLAAGSASTALAASVIAWIRSRTGRVRIVVKAKGKQVELDSATVRALDGEAIAKLTTTLVDALNSETEK